MVCSAGKRPALERLDTESFEEIRRNYVALDVLGLRNSRQIKGFFFVRGEFVEETGLCAPIEEVGIRGFADELAGFQIQSADPYETFGVRIRECANQYRIENAEHSRVGADADGYGEDGSRNEAR